jgi:hypothetical protein
MTSDEREIFHFLKSLGHEYVSGAEIARRASSRKRFHKDPSWAKPILMTMAERHILESDVNGRYRIKPVPRKKKGNRWVAPEIAKILKESGVEVEDSASATETVDDEFYEQL